MSLHRRDPRRDENEPPIVKALRQAGATVHQLSGKGIPDLLVGFRDQTYLMEIKAPLGPKGGSSHRNLSDDEDEFFRKWRGGSLRVIRTIPEALRVVGAIDNPRSYGS